MIQTQKMVTLSTILEISSCLSDKTVDGLCSPNWHAHVFLRSPNRCRTYFVSVWTRLKTARGTKNASPYIAEGEGRFWPHFRSFRSACSSYGVPCFLVLQSSVQRNEFRQTHGRIITLVFLLGRTVLNGSVVRVVSSCVFSILITVSPKILR